MRTVVFRLIIFYVCAITVMLAMTPWSQTGSATVGGSPFVRAFGAVGIPFAASLMNIVVITAALSSANTNLYLSTRMLFSLSRIRYAPRWLGGLSRNGVPHAALGISTGGMVAAILLAIFAPKGAFLLLYGTAVAGMYFVWIVILMSHIGFRRKLGTDALANLPLRLPAQSVLSVSGIVVLSAIAATTFFVEGLKNTVPTFVVFLVVMSVIYWRARHRAV
jgi:L-asparagine transporter-like permease